jgi:hypothetical protein
LLRGIRISGNLLNPHCIIDLKLFSAHMLQEARLADARLLNPVDYSGLA